MPLLMTQQRLMEKTTIAAALHNAVFHFLTFSAHLAHLTRELLDATTGNPDNRRPEVKVMGIPPLSL